MPSTAIASISSRMVRAPRSAQIADPAAPEIISAVTIGLACWITASTLAAPVNDCAPICTVSEPSCSAITAPNGIATSAAGSTVTLATNQNCSISSRTWNGRRKVSRTTSRPEGEQLADVGEGAGQQTRADVLDGGRHPAGWWIGGRARGRAARTELTSGPPRADHRGRRQGSRTRARAREDHAKVTAAPPQPNTKELRPANKRCGSRFGRPRDTRSG